MQLDTSTLCARGGHKMPCMAAPLWGEGECSSPISGQWAPLQLSRWPSYEAPRPAVKSVCYPSCSQLLRCVIHVTSATCSLANSWSRQRDGRRGSVISWRHSSSIVCVAAVSQATQAGTSSHRRQLRNECTRPTAECRHQSLAVINRCRRG